MNGPLFRVRKIVEGWIDETIRNSSGVLHSWHGRVSGSRAGELPSAASAESPELLLLCGAGLRQPVEKLVDGAVSEPEGAGAPEEATKG